MLISVFEVVEGKFEEAYNRINDILASYAEVDGLNCRMDTMATAVEGRNLLVFQYQHKYK